MTHRYDPARTPFPRRLLVQPPTDRGAAASPEAQSRQLRRQVAREAARDAKRAARRERRQGRGPGGAS